ncbi:MAG: DUF502 domain-containing protein [Anaerolineae bacterium]
MKKYLATGVIILLPLALTMIIIFWFFDLLTEPFIGLVEALLAPYRKASRVSLLQYDAILLFASRLIALALLFIIIFLLGFITHKFFSKSIERLTSRMFLRIPFIKTIYSLSRDVTKSLFSSNGKTFKQTVLVPFPSKETHAVGFVTGDLPETLKKVMTEAEVSVFVPTSPHPISGFVLLSPKRQLLDIQMTTEEAFGFLLSCGAVHPPEGHLEKKNDPQEG